MRQLGGNLVSGSECNIEKEESMGALGKRPRGLTQAGGLQPSGDPSGVECLQNRAVAYDLDLLYSDLCTGEVRHSQLVNQVYPPVRAHKRYGRVLDCQQKRCHIL
jgi:hypothetical protein